MLPTQKYIESYYVYVYTFLDDLSFVRNPFEHFQYEDEYRIKDAIHLVSKKFKEHGWEGDGEIGIIWLPPFVDLGVHDTYGTYIWHVKQRNNGISFLACDIPLDSDRLREQNEGWITSGRRDGLTPISIIETYVRRFCKQVDDVRDNLKNSITFLSEGTSTGISDMIKQSLNTYNQGLLIRNFHELLDECYLQVLIQVIERGNPYKIKLRRSKVKIDATNYIPELDDDINIEEAASLFTIRGIISDMWRAYKWQPFKEKTEMLFKSLDYTVDATKFYEIKKHVVLKNCIHHHEGCLDRDSLSQLGKDQIELKMAQGTCCIDAWKPIIITEQEVFFLCSVLLQFVEDFHTHFKKRIPEICYMSNPGQHSA